MSDEKPEVEEKPKEVKKTKKKVTKKAPKKADSSKEEKVFLGYHPHTGEKVYK